MVNSNDGGANVSFNGGETWSAQPFPDGAVVSRRNNSRLPIPCVRAQQDNTTICVPSDAATNHRDPRSPAGSWMYAVGGGESGYIAPDPRNPDIFTPVAKGALLTKYDRSTARAATFRFTRSSSPACRPVH